MSGFQKHNYYAVVGSAVITIILISIGVKFETALILSLSGYLGANFPDLDTTSIPSMWAARFVIISSAYFIYIDKLIYAVIVGIIFAAPKIKEHRGWTHKYSTLVLIPVITYFTFEIYTLITISFSAGLLIHYTVDKLNPFKFKNWI